MSKTECGEKQGWIFTVTGAAEYLGVPAKEVRYFLRRGLVPQVRRARNGYRELAEWQVDWLRTLVGLKQCGMGVDEMRRYMWSCRRGGAEEVEKRRAMLETKKRQLWQEIEEAQSAIDFIERKGEIFGRILEKKDEGLSGWV